MKRKAKQTGLVRAIGYCRVSSDEQARSGLGLEAQRERIEAYARMRTLELVDVITDAGVSGGVPLAKRPGGARVVGLVKRGEVGAVVLVKLDRAFRNTRDCLSVVDEWDKRGVGLCVTDMGGNAVDTQSAAGRFMLTVLAGAAEMERKQAGERTKAALERVRARGKKTGGAVPYGFQADKNGVLRVNAKEAATAREIQRLRTSGHSLRNIAAHLKSTGQKTKQGATWKPSQIQAAIKNVSRFCQG